MTILELILGRRKRGKRILVSYDYVTEFNKEPDTERPVSGDSVAVLETSAAFSLFRSTFHKQQMDTERREKAGTPLQVIKQMVRNWFQ
jgi:hypothetical protein